MTIHLKIPRELYTEIKDDLNRKHEYAYERVGFVFGKVGVINKNNQIVILSQYLTVADKNYIDDPRVGASINSEAIRIVLQKALNEASCVFHVHTHSWKGKPELSSSDIKGIIPLLPSFFAINPSGIHGILLLSQDSVAAWILLSNSNNITRISRISIIGYPIELIR